MKINQHFTGEQARQFGEEFGINWEWIHSSRQQRPTGLDAEEEHGLNYPPANVAGKPSTPTGRIKPIESNKYTD